MGVAGNRSFRRPEQREWQSKGKGAWLWAGITLWGAELEGSHGQRYWQGKREGAWLVPRPGSPRGRCRHLRALNERWTRSRAGTVNIHIYIYVFK